ncbi:hypothetical protein SESBI_10731 [Sesbania bispinosa]|nr:hypothetical protein SESBI_10731 [Sesbania bispinosa]
MKALVVDRALWGYLFGSEDQQPSHQPLSTKTVSLPPYGIDIDNAKCPDAPPPSVVFSNNRSQGHHMGNFVHRK